jgi:hypothetical protein
MATIDISRRAFDPRKHYSSVRMQQGRVIVDDDWNENERIENEDRRAANVDIIGRSGSPDQGFRIADARIADGMIDFDALPGTFYLGGLRLDLENKETYRTQKDWLQQPDDLHKAPESERFDLVYLVAWQQPVGAVEDSELFEVALGGPDTSMRVRNMRRIKLWGDVQTADCAVAWQKLISELEAKNNGKINDENEALPDVRLTVSFSEDGVSEDICKPSVLGGYLGAENQTIRVQLVDKGHFTWGFDNASPLYRVEVNESGETVMLLTDPKDQAHWPLSGQVVEILPWSAVLPNREKVSGMRGHLSLVNSSYDPDTRELTLTNPLPSGFGEEWKPRSDADELKEPSEYLFMRVWNRGSDRSSDPAISFTPGTAVKLGNTGLKVTITGDDRVPGHYWIIAARPETPDRVVPWELEKALPPHGVRRFHAPLAMIHWRTNSAGDIEGEVIRDCRRRFRPLTELKTCCTYFVGDGVHSQGDFNSIEEAVKNLPPEGGKICVLPGEHLANVILENLRDVHITGCGAHTIIRPRPDQMSNPIFLIRSSRNIQLDNMTLIALYGTAIQVEDPAQAQQDSRGIKIEYNHIIARIHAINISVDNGVAGDNDIRITYNQIEMLDKPDGRAAIFSIADGVLIERNRIFVVPAPDPDDSNDPREPGGPSDEVYDDCAEPESFYEQGFAIREFVYEMVSYVTMVISTLRITYLAEGGIQIGGGSERVKIVENEIVGGRSNGVTLGHLPLEIFDDSELSQIPVISELSDKTLEYLRAYFAGDLYEIAIEENIIQNMGLAGVGAVAFFSSRAVGLMVRVEELTIYRNTIKNCVQQMPAEIPRNMVMQVGFGGIMLADCENAVIQENQIGDNGVSHVEPVCGIFILYGEGVDISNNRILNNGPRTSYDDRNVRLGLRGGIVIGMALKKLERREFNDQELLYNDGIPAVKVHDNIVTQPLGQALLMMAMGPVSVIGNQMTSQGPDSAVNPLSLIAGTVFIVNLGISKDLVGALLVSRLRGMVNADVTNAEKVSGAILAALKLLYLPSGNVIFADNQITLDLRAPEVSGTISSQLIASLDDVAYNSNQSECTSLLDFVIIDAAIFGVTIRSNDNRFQEGLTQARYSLFSYGIMNTASNNQATHCLHILGNPAFTVDDNNRILYSTGCDEANKRIRERINVPKMVATNRVIS